jgi:HEAT repeat protein
MDADKCYMSPNLKRLSLDLVSGDEDRKTAALREIMDLVQNNPGDPSFFPPLLVVLDDSKTEFRQMSSWSLGKMAQSGVGDESELEPLAASLLDTDEEVRENAAWALGELAGLHIGAKQELGPLTDLLLDDTATIRGMAAWAIGRLAQRMGLIDERSIAPLELLIADKSLYVSKGAEYALQRLKEKL